MRTHLRRDLSLAVLGLWALAALAGPLLPLAPNAIDLGQILNPPTAGAWLGSDELGRSIIGRLIVGARSSFFIAWTVVTISALVGISFGIVSAWLGGWWDLVLVRLIDIFLAFPGLLLAIALAGLMGPGLSNVVIALSVVGWIGYARLARAQVLALKTRDHVLAAQALGIRTQVILVRHLLPLIAAPLIVEATFGIAAVVISEASLSFLGLGVQPPDASWGAMIRDGVRYMLMAPHLVIFPGLTLVLVVLAVNLLGDALRDHFDVRR